MGLYNVEVAQIEKLFVSSLHKKVWDHFTKAQRKNIEVWKKTALEIKTLPSEIQESINDDEMDVSDSDSDDVSLYKKRKLDVHETNSLKDENDSLRCQLEAYKNEICVVRSELHCEISRKSEQVTILQKTLNTLSQEMDKLKKQQIPTSELPTTCKPNEKEAQEADTTVIPWTSNLTNLVEREAKLLGLISVFLHVHPFGAGVEYICSFLQKTIPNLRVTEIEHTMCRFPSVFQQEVVGIGANMERRWKFVGFNIESDLSLAQS